MHHKDRPLNLLVQGPIDSGISGNHYLLMTSLSFDRSQLRRKLRNARNKLTPQQQTNAAIGLLNTLKKELFYRRAKRVAFYLPNDGEISPLPLIKLSESLGKRCYLPVLHPQRQGQLLFGEYCDNDKLCHNRFGIAEPDLRQRKHCQAFAMDLVFLPLVGFDNQGNRLGMGGGFYDRSFAFKRHAARRYQKPLLVGLAHNLQQVDALPAEPWDVPLFGIATDNGFRHTA